MAGASLIKFVCDLCYLAVSYNAKMVCFGEGAMKLCMHENAVLLLPVNIWCGTLAFLATQHTTMCLEKKT